MLQPSDLCCSSSAARRDLFCIPCILNAFLLTMAVKNGYLSSNQSDHLSGSSLFTLVYCLAFFHRLCSCFCICSVDAPILLPVLVKFDPKKVHHTCDHPLVNRFFFF